MRTQHLFTVIACVWTLAAPSAEAPAISRERVESRSEQRTFYLFEPADRESRPLLVLLHGTGGTGRDLAERWRSLADQERVILAAPVSMDAVGWRVPRDGPELFRDVVDAVSARRRVDRRRIYLVGYSAGGDAALFASLAQSEYFAASAILAAALRPRQYPLLDLAVRRIPIALFAATRDAAYPVAEARATRDAFDARRYPLQYVELEGRDHGFVGGSDTVRRQAWAFLQAHALSTAPVYQPLGERILSFALR